MPKQSGELLHRASFAREVQLAANGAREMVDQPDRVEDLASGMCRSISIASSDIRTRSRSTSRTTLGRRIFTASGVPSKWRGAMHLPERSGGQRLGIELGKQLVDRQSELGLDDLSGHFGRERGNVLPQLRQLFNDVAGTRSGRVLDHLPELDERRPQAFEGQANAFGPRMNGDGPFLLPEQHAAAPLQVAPQVQPFDEVAEAVLQQDGGNLATATEAAQNSKGMRLQETAP